MSNSTCRHPVTGWNNGSHYINTQPDSAIKWKKTLPKAPLQPPDRRVWHVFLTQHVFFNISHTKDRTGKLRGVKSPWSVHKDWTPQLPATIPADRSSALFTIDYCPDNADKGWGSSVTRPSSLSLSPSFILSAWKLCNEMPFKHNAALP